MADVCDYDNSTGLFTGYGACVAQREAPAGCPLYFTTAQAVDPASIVVYVVDPNGNPINATSQTSEVGTLAGTSSYVDVNTCDCEHVTAPITVHQFMTTLTGAQPGDGVTISIGQDSVAHAFVAVTAAGPCPAPDWPTAFENRTPCDLCPMPIDTDDSGGGCSVSSGGGSLLAGLALTLLVARARRYRPRRSSASS